MHAPCPVLGLTFDLRSSEHLGSVFIARFVIHSQTWLYFITPKFVPQQFLDQSVCPFGVNFINVNVTVDVYSLISPWVQQTLQFTPLVLELSYTVASPLGRIQRIFCSWCHSQFSNFLFHQVPITAGWAEAVWNEKFAPPPPPPPTLLHMTLYPSVIT